MIRSYLTCETLFAISKGSRLTLNNITLITIKNCLANSKKVSNINGTFTIIAFWLSMTLIFFSFSLLSSSTAGSSRCVYCAHEDRSSPHSCTKETTLSRQFSPAFQTHEIDLISYLFITLFQHTEPTIYFLTQSQIWICISCLLALLTGSCMSNILVHFATYNLPRLLPLPLDFEVQLTELLALC